MRTVLCVLFDVDDTLFDHTFASQAALRLVTQADPRLAETEFQPMLTANMRILEQLHPEVVAGRVRLDDARVERFRRLLAQFGGDVARAADMAEAFREAYGRHERLVPGVDALLPRLRRFGVRLGIVSNNTLATQEAKLSRLGIDAHFEELIVSAEHGISKPDPRLFDVALRRIGISAADSVHVGDRWDLDVVGARSAGVAPVWFNRFGLGRGDTGPVAQLASFGDAAAATAVILDFGGDDAA
ncbi:MAG TPA: HAD-IA family hydrolase [Burkholderiaceae bacterium]|nr:HAD-IA family hydrolase [Burkholderiaceae bacterium]